MALGVQVYTAWRESGQASAMAKIVPELEFMLENPTWLKGQVGETPETFGPLLGWTKMLGVLDELPGEPSERLALAAICAHAITAQHVLGFCAGLSVMEKMGISVPRRGRPGFVGALIVGKGFTDDLIAESRECWHRAKEHFPEIAEELDSYDQRAREAILSVLRHLDYPPRSHDRIVDVSVGFDKPARHRTPTRSGFIGAFAWKRYLEDPNAPIAPANRRESEMLGSYMRVQATLRGLEPPMGSMPNPFPRDFQCTCGEELDRYLFCCDPARLHTRASLEGVDERLQLAPCEACGETVFGFHCDGCGAAHCWVYGVVDSHQLKP